MKLTSKFLLLSLLAALVSGDSKQQENDHQKQQASQKVTSGNDGSEKSTIAGADRAQNKRGAPVIPTIVGTPQHTYINQPAGPAAGIIATSVTNHPVVAGTPGIAAVSPLAYATSYGQPHHGLGQLEQNVGSPQTVYHKINYVAPNSALKVATYAAPVHYEYAPTLAKYNYAAASIPQYQYAHYPQYQVYQHHQTPTGTYITTAVQQAATAFHHQQQQPATIYAAHQPAAATIHYTLTAAQPLIHQQQQQHQQNYHPSLQSHHSQTPGPTTFHYQQQQHPGTATLVGVQPQVPVVHQAPIAAINQVHQANQLYAAQAQLAKYPVPTGSPIYGAAPTSNQIYHQPTNYAAYQVPLAAKQIVSTVAAPTIATPSHIKQLIPLTTASTTHHHGKGVSYATFTQQVNPAVLSQLQTNTPYYNTAASSTNYQQHHQQQQQQLQHHQQQPIHHYQQPRFQIYSTVATPVQKPGILYAAPYAQPSIPAAIYATSGTPLQYHQQQQQQQQQIQQQQQQQSQQSIHYGPQLYQQQQQSFAPLAKITYTPGAASLQKGFYPIQ
ncbi:putative mediator of RNA polymerase II transcription subunit 26 [Topomyia yanbarensis]|uniref:putative mediator of RNA polymerase II transcription subunit 26 n=1 Tax=Topomyia yanbarensis TaxID=2498891 RepID=UPI00273BEDF4|nr:putative mediator of RNA polymerase II transcription subunit 26 [Topomyia yanbarensis]